MKRSRTAEALGSSKKSKTISSTTVTVPERETSDQGETFWQISPKRRITISEFKGNTLVGIREFYEKDGKMLPGKSGISLTIEQFTALMLAVPDIKKALTGQGVDIDDDAGSEEEEGGSSEAVVKKSTKTKAKEKGKKSKKDKFVVSDEEEEEEEEEEDDD